MTAGRGAEVAAGPTGGGRAALRIAGAAAVILYPPLVWLGLSQGSPRTAALVLLACVVPAAVLKLRGSDRAALRGLAYLPLITVALLVLGAALDSAGFVLAVPSAINAGFLLAFGSTLRPGVQPMVERFARLTLDDPTAEQRAWCRLWTWIWCAFFVVNGSIAAGLALWAELPLWATYNGLVAYLLSGSLLATEWVLRRRRFGSG